MRIMAYLYVLGYEPINILHIQILFCGCEILPSGYKFLLSGHQDIFFCLYVVDII